MLKCIVGILCIPLLGVAIAGCGGGVKSQRAKVYKVTGTVKYVGSPLIGAIVTFAPLENQPAAVGRTNDAGEFTLTTYSGGDGAAAGQYKILVMLQVNPDQTPASASHSMDPSWVPPATSHSAGSAKTGGSVLPAKYSDLSQTPLAAKVDPNGANQFPLDLK